MIVVNSLSKYYGSFKAIDDVSFSIKQGEIVGLLGLNGAGKSTILKILGCFLMPSRGTATIDGASVTDDPQAIRKMIGYLPDTPPLYDEMTVESYLGYVARLKNVRESDVKSCVDAAMGKTNTTEVAAVRLGELSHGFRQRAGIAQALVHDPKVLILDEPINGLDPVQIVEMRDLIVSLKGRHTVVLSSHILSEITKTCDRVLIIDEGRLIAEGSEDSLHGAATKSMLLHVDVDKTSDALTSKLRGLSGITKIDLGPAPFGGARLTIESNHDVRSEVARTVVASGAGLLGLSRAEAGLEGVFMKMIRSSGGQGG